MKFKTLFSVAIASLATSFAFADQGDVMITFSTPGPDKYADGTTVVDKEWYALCWTKNDSFGGLTTACKPAVEGDEMLLAAPLAEGGKCPFVAFEFARNDKYDSGKFTVLMLDTRKNGVPAASVNGLPSFVKETAIASTTVKGGSMTAAAETSVAAGTVAWAKNSFAEGTKTAVDSNLVKISAMEVLDANIKLTVENPQAAALVVKSGETVDAMNTYEFAPSASETSGTTTTFIIPKSNAKFFSVGGLK